MKLLFKLLPFLLIVNGFSQNNNYEVQPINNVTIDGDLSDWQSISTSSPFVDHATGNPTTQLTTMKLAWDSENLFVAYYVEDTEQTFTALNQDGYIFQKDDLVEFFIDPDGDGVNYIEVGVNGLNVYYDFIIKCPGGDCGAWSDDQVFDLQGFESAVTKDNSQYTVEIKIPFTALNAVTDGGFTTPMDGDSWKANFFRIDQTSGASAEYQAWNSHESFGYHQPSKFGTITFKEVFTSSTSIANIVNVYPNPTSGRLNISKEVDTITVTDVTGATVISENNTSSIDLSSYTSGIYTVNIETADQVITQKVIVE